MDISQHGYKQMSVSKPPLSLGEEPEHMPPPVKHTPSTPQSHESK